MIETDATYVVKSSASIGIPDDRLKEILRAAEEIRSTGTSRNDILEKIYQFAPYGTKESMMERLVMAYFAGNQSKNARKIKNFAIHNKELS